MPGPYIRPEGYAVSMKISGNLGGVGRDAPVPPLPCGGRYVPRVYHRVCGQRPCPHPAAALLHRPVSTGTPHSRQQTKMCRPAAAHKGGDKAAQKIVSTDEPNGREQKQSPAKALGHGGRAPNARRRLPIPFCHGNQPGGGNDPNHSCRMASRALILTARLAGAMPDSRPITVAKASAASSSQGGMMDSCAVLS